MANIFEHHYKRIGFKSQRMYPNEFLIQFLSSNYFHLPLGGRGKLKCLDLGCGSGANLWMLSREGFDVYGIDNSKAGIKLAKQMLKKWSAKAKLYVQDFRKLDFPDNFFDVMVDVVSLQHLNLAGHRQALSEIYRCLKSGGRFFSWHLGANSDSFKKSGGVMIDKLTVDNINNKKMPLNGNGEVCFLTYKEARTMLMSEGFVDLKIEKMIRTYENMTQKVEYLSIWAKK